MRDQHEEDDNQFFNQEMENMQLSSQQSYQPQLQRNVFQSSMLRSPTKVNRSARSKDKSPATPHQMETRKDKRNRKAEIFKGLLQEELARKK